MGGSSAAQSVIESIMSVPDKAVPDEIARNAECIAVVPGVVKGAFIVAPNMGKGSDVPDASRMERASVHSPGGRIFGFQIGGQGTDLVLVAINDKGFQDLLHDKFKIGGDASAVPGPWDATRRLQPISACVLNCSPGRAATGSLPAST